HERNPKWSPDGKWIAYVSDASGEDEIHIAPQDGSGAAQQITSGGPPYKYEVRWSPDSKKILWSDKQMRLFYVEVATKKVTQVAKSDEWEIHQFEWSPDSKWVSYAKPERRGMNTVYLYSLEQAKSFAVTDPWYDSYAPSFSSDGKYLFFISERDFNPIYSATEWNHAYADMARIYFATLSKETPSPFRPKSDEVDTGQKEEKKDDKPAAKDGKGKETPLQIDTDG